uniref:Uncharacterized protein n=1 Tax=Salix viminalis TaxID=40686 RepID=A0A6N2MID6_SALVM
MSSMAGTCTFISRLDLGGGGGASFCWARISAMNSNECLAREVALSRKDVLHIRWPIETASQETLEALYCQARDAYYSGKPLIVDDMFDRVELKLRWYGSKSVVKYPRCSIRRHSTYSDAEDDISQAFALASIWIFFLTIGSSACTLPIIYTVGLAYQNAFGSGIAHGSQATIIGFLATVNGILFMAVGSLIGYPIASASGINLEVQILSGLLSCVYGTNSQLYSRQVKQAIASRPLRMTCGFKGACPNCGEEVFAFVKSDQSNDSHIEQIVMYVKVYLNSEPRLRGKYANLAKHFKSRKTVGLWAHIPGITKTSEMEHAICYSVEMTEGRRLIEQNFGGNAKEP